MGNGIYPDDYAAMCTPGKPWRPSNGTEGEIFYESYCAECKHEKPDEPCMIFGAALFYQLGEEGYPKEWIYGPDGQPKCTAFWQYDCPDEPFNDDPNQTDLFR